MNFEFLAEMEKTSCSIRDEIITALQSVNVGVEVVEYVRGCHLYFKAPFLLTMWQLVPEVRMRLAIDMGMHIMSLKLGDDLVDNDMSTDRLSLGVGSLHLSHLAVKRMCNYLDPSVLLPLLSDSMAELCRAQIVATRNPAVTFTEWRDHADGYGGGFLRIYARIATMLDSAKYTVDSACRFATGFGNIITLSDDLRDYSRTGERSGNLAALILSSAASVEEVTAFVNEMRDLAISGSRQQQTAHDLRPIIDFFVRDILSRMLPSVIEGRPA